MKLYYAPGACSLAPHIILRELGLEPDLIQVDLFSKKTEFGDDYLTINPLGRVPTLQLDNQETLTEAVAILQYLADQYPAAELAPENGSLARARLYETLNFLSSDLHKAFSPLFAGASDNEKQNAVQIVESRLDLLDHQLINKTYLIEDQFSVADAYLFVLTSWTTPTGIGLEKLPNLAKYFDRIASKSSVHEALLAEGLVG